MDVLLPVDLGRAVRRRRKDLGLSQADFAKQVGVTQAWLSALERGKDGAAFGTVCRVMAYLDLKLAVVAKGDTVVTRPRSDDGGGQQPVINTLTYPPLPTATWSTEDSPLERGIRELREKRAAQNYHPPKPTGWTGGDDD